jgi:hypothetical protein
MSSLQTWKGGRPHPLRAARAIASPEGRGDYAEAESAGLAEFARSEVAARFGDEDDGFLSKP